MPEVILPCPACGSPVDIVGGDEWHNRNQFFIKCSCGSCCVADTVRKECIERWNDLPRYRALRWTHEPPKVAGWYWRKETVADLAHVFHFTGNWEDYGEHWESDRVCQLPLILNDNLWAGPIAPPID